MRIVSGIAQFTIDFGGKRLGTVSLSAEPIGWWSRFIWNTLRLRLGATWEELS